MTNRQMVDKYLASIGMKLVQGGGTLEPILPFFMTDVAFNMWMKDIAPIPCRHELKKLKKDWLSTYSRFNRRFFNAFTIDEQDEIIDKMDSFDSYIDNHVMIAKVQIMNIMNDLEFEDAVRCSSLIIINIMCQSAGIVWRNVYKNGRMQDRNNPEITALERLSSRFMNGYHSAISDKKVNPNESKPIVDAVDILCQKLIKWLYVDRDESAQNPPEMTIQCKK